MHVLKISAVKGVRQKLLRAGAPPDIYHRLHPQSPAPSDAPVVRHDASTIGQSQKLDRRQVLLTTGSTCRGEVQSMGDKVSEGFLDVPEF